MGVRTSIIGPTGYTGIWLIELLARHPHAELTYLASRRQSQPDITEVFPQLRGRLPASVATCKPIDAKAIASEADIAFCCLPHTVAMALVPGLLRANLRIVDLSADYRLRDAEVYESTYGHRHADLENLRRAVYGLPELFRKDLASASLVCNPGCYPTAAALAIAPLLAARLVRPDGIIINAATGVTGAGRSPQQAYHFPEHNEAFRAYGTIGAHRHQPEILQTLANAAGTEVDALFVPHVLPVDQGILETIYLDPVSRDTTEANLNDCFKDAYLNEPFVRVVEDLPNIRHVQHTNYCDVAVRRVETARGVKVVVFSAIDNMVKGASGQALQNMNVMFGLEETAGLG